MNFKMVLPIVTRSYSRQEAVPCKHVRDTQTMHQYSEKYKMTKLWYRHEEILLRVYFTYQPAKQLSLAKQQFHHEQIRFVSTYASFF